jgi:hypothetical protein
MSDFSQTPATELRQQLRDAIPKLAEADRDFATALLRSINPSPKQRHWIQILINRTQIANFDGTGNYKAIIELFDSALQKLKRPTIIVHSESGDLALKPAGAQSRNPGFIYVLTDPAGEYSGKIDPTGTRFTPGSETGLETATAIKAALLALAQDPVAAAKAYGARTGNCCFCRRLLTDARSTAEGYGPICATRFGLPWG